MEEKEEPPLVPPQAVEQELNQDPSHQEDMQQQPFLGFGMDPNWGGFGQQMMQPGYHHQPGAMDQQLIPGLAPSMDPLEALLGPFPCARVRGLPFEATLEDILVFFQGLVVIDVVLVPNEESGEAYVVFANLIDYQMGLQRDQQSMGNRYLEVFHGKRSEYYAAVASQQHHWQGGGALLGSNASEEQISATGSGGEELSEAGASLKSNRTGGSAWGKPGSPIQPARQMGSQMGHHGHGRGHPYRGGRGHYGGRGRHYGGRGGYNRNYGGGQQGHNGGGNRDGPHTGFLRMRGLPFQATKEDVAEFFKDYKPVPDSIILTYRMDGRSTGEAYVEFETPDSAKEAMTLHRSTIGSRYIELFISNKEEHTRNVARSTPR